MGCTQTSVIGYWHGINRTGFIEIREAQIRYEKDNLLVNYVRERDKLKIFFNGKDEKPYQFRLLEVTKDSIIWESIEMEYIDTLIRISDVKR